MENRKASGRPVGKYKKPEAGGKRTGKAVRKQAEKTEKAGPKSNKEDNYPDKA